MNTLPAELQRIDFTGTVWFAAGLVALAVVLAGAYTTGWRPTQLRRPLTVLWWAAGLVTVAGLGCLAWAGCPVYGGDLATIDQQKSLCIRTGTATVLGGIVIMVALLLTSPAPRTQNLRRYDVEHLDRS